ncbi:2-amino-4-hydroxy-6-hydroxymethyldihydropteridine diphosphokinase [Pseudobacter ginsenosidimutans]|jgi:2-amino-4-hydroxy-6-hydroxymethyldihydropteridine diphosphokinase|nr:2-amino-4-hydroxy-6-hydroxymethyldihydropteridine diphosphokinase [Pseudobacter ginsenosidimutans]QEC42725.1 2-amino-4-hydroxy-6-hydroxymethyldihydropteridine diphosphokinase [Pseudobacter ginsenosidimutans]
MNKAYLLIGGNMGNRVEQLQLAVDHIRQRVGQVEQVSALYETAAWGKTDQPSFLNQALLVHTQLEPLPLLKELLSIELEMGRERLEKNGPRTIDIDIIFYNDAIISEPGLLVPHPAMAQRRFVLAPLAEIAPDLQHPQLKQTMRKLLEACTDPLPVARFN